MENSTLKISFYIYITYIKNLITLNANQQRFEEEQMKNNMFKVYLINFFVKNWS